MFAMIPSHRMLLGLAALVLFFSSDSIAQDDSPPRAFQGQDDSVYPVFPAPAPDAPTARLRMVFDLVSGAQELSVEPLQPFDVYVVAHDVQIAVRGWEATLVIDPRLQVIERDVPAEFDMGQGNEVSAALKPRDCLSGNPVVLARLRLMLLEDGHTDLVLGLAPVARPSEPTVASDLEGPTPMYLTCVPETDLRPFDYCRSCAVVNPVGVRPERDESPKDRLREVLAPVRGRG